MSKYIRLYLFYSFLFSFLLSFMNLFSQLYWEKGFDAVNLRTFTPAIICGIVIDNNDIIINYSGYNSSGYTNPGILITDLSGNIIKRKEIIRNNYVKVVNIIHRNNEYQVFSAYDYRNIKPDNYLHVFVPHKLALNEELNIISETFDSTKKDLKLSLFQGWEFAQESIYVAREKTYRDSINFYYYYTILVMDYSLNYIRDINTPDIRPSDDKWNRFNISRFLLTKDQQFVYLINYTNSNSEDVWEESALLKVNFEGKLEKTTRIKYKEKLTWMKSVIETETGDYLCLGITSPDIPPEEKHLADTLGIQIDSLLLVKISKSGEIIWQKEHPLPNKTDFWAQIRPFPNLKAYGLYGGYVKKGSLQYNKSENCIYLFNDSGDIIFHLTWTPDTSLSCNISGLASKGDIIYALGYMTDNLFMGKGYLCAINPDLAGVIENKQVESDGLSPFPNPVTDYINLENIHHVLTGRILVFSMEGIPVLEADYSDKLYVSGLQPGVYYLRAGMKYFKFIKI